MEKVVITGLGAFCSIGNTIEDFWDALIHGKNGYVGNDEYLKDIPFKLCGVIKNLDINRYLSLDEISNNDICAQYALSASIMAVNDAKIEFDNLSRDRVAVIIGTTTATNFSIEKFDFFNKWFSDKKRINQNNYRLYHHVDIANSISKHYQLSGASYIVGTACAAGNHSIGEAADLIKLNKADVVICGGVESLSLLSLIGFNSLKSLATECCAPFDENRNGIVIGEGAGILILESEKHALGRGAKIYAELSAWSANCDAESITAPIEDGTRCAELIKSCFHESNSSPEDIDFISLHGTGTKKNDITETNAIHLSFKEYWNKPFVTSIKSMIGHTFGAAGSLNSIVAILAINRGIIPPTINLKNQDKELNLNIVKKIYFETKVKKALSLSFGFGGCNIACLFNEYNCAI